MKIPHGLAGLLALALATPALGLDLNSSTVPGRLPGSPGWTQPLGPGEIAINRADKRLIFKNVDGTLGYGSLLNALPCGRSTVELGDGSCLTLGSGGPTIPSALAGKAPLASPSFSGTSTFTGPISITAPGSTGPIDGMTVTPNASAPAGTTPIPLSILFGDLIDARLLGITLDDTTDDSCAVRNALAALAGTGKKIFAARGQITLGGACQATVEGTGIVGLRVDDYANNGSRGSVIRITDTTKPAFLIGVDATFDGLNWLYPNQTEAAANANGGPIVYPATFAPKAVGAIVSNLRFEHNHVENPYDLFGFEAATIGKNTISNNRIYAVRSILRLTNAPDITFFSDNVLGPAAYQVQTVGQATRTLAAYTAANGSVVVVTGNGTPTSASTLGEVDGLQASNNFVFGYDALVRVSGGILTQATMIGTGIDATPSILRVEPGGAAASTSITGGYALAHRFGSPSADVPALVSIISPAPAADGTPLTEVVVTGMDVSLARSNVFDVYGANVGAFTWSGGKIGHYGANTGGAAQYYAGRVVAPNARVKINGVDVSPQGSPARKYGIQVAAAGSAAITSNTLANVAVPVDIQDTAGAIFIGGNNSVGSGNPGSLAGNGSTLTTSLTTGTMPGAPNTGHIVTALGGTMTAGNTVTLTASSSVFNGGASASATYTVAAGDTTSSVAEGLRAAVGANAAMAKAGFFLIRAGAQLTSYAPPDLNLAVAVTVSSGATLTVAGPFGLGATFGGNVHEVGNGWDKPFDAIRFSAVSGGTYTILSGQRTVRLVQTGTIASYTLTLPVPPIDGYVQRIASVGAVTSLTLTPQSGATIVGAPTALAAGGSVALIWDAAGTQWLRLQ